MSKNTQERRKAKRRPILDSFSLFVVVPSKGPQRLKVHDVSELGIGFEHEAPAPEFAISPGEKLEVQLYLNQSLFLPISVKVIRADSEKGGLNLVGAEFAERASPGYKALDAFVTLLDRVIDAGQLST